MSSAWAAAAGQIGGAAVSAIGASKLNEETMEFNAAQAEISRHHANYQQNQAQGFAERMSNTAHQRSVADMKAAGLNPGLMYGSSGPASTPNSPAGGGQQATGQSGAAPFVSAIQGGLAGVMDAYKLANEVKRTDQQEKQTDSNIKLNISNAELNSAHAGKLRAETRRTKSTQGVVDRGAKYLEEGSDAINSAVKKAKDAVGEKIDEHFNGQGRGPSADDGWNERVWKNER